MNYLERREYLDQFRDPERVERLVKAVARFPAALRELGFVLLKRDAHGRPLQREQLYQSSYQKRRAAAFQALVDLPPPDRGKIVDVFFPKIKPYVLSGWEMIYERPYVIGSGSTALRAPHQPTWSHYRLMDWFQSLVTSLIEFDQDIFWIAEHSHSAFLGWKWDTHAAILLAAAIDADDENSEPVMQLLFTIARGDHPQALLGRYLIGALLNCARQEAWEFSENLLLSAQRQEGLRQVILESVDMAHPEAFRRMVRLMNDHNLARFNSTIRAVDVWFQLGFDATQTKQVQQVLTMLERFLDDPALAERACWDEDPQIGYVALLARGFADVEVSLVEAANLIAAGSPDQRLMAARFCVLSQCPPGNELLAGLLGDEDQHIQAIAFQQLASRSQIEGDELFQKVAQLIPSLPPKEKELPPRIWPWWKLTLNPKLAGRLLLQCLHGRPLQPIFPYFHLLESHLKRAVIQELRKTQADWDDATRGEMVAWLGDRSRDVRREAAVGLSGLTLTQEELCQLEGYLTRKASDLRKNVLKLILAQTDEAAFASAARLLSAKKIAQRQAGLELLVNLFSAERQPARCLELAGLYQTQATKLNATEEALIRQILVDTAVAPQVTLEDGLGLINNERRTRPVVPRKVDFQPVTPLSLDLIHSLDQCVDNHHELTFERTFRGGKTETFVLGHIQWAHQFPHFDRELTREENLKQLPFQDIWLQWLAEQQSKIDDGDGFDLVRALTIANAHHSVEKIPDLGDILPQKNYWKSTKHPQVVQALFNWFNWLYPPAGDVIDFALDGVEYTFWHLLHAEGFQNCWLLNGGGHSAASAWLSTWNWLKIHLGDRISSQHHVRLWRLFRWRDEPTLVLPEEAANGLVGKVLNTVTPGLTAEKLTKRLLGEAAAYYTRMPRRRPSLTELMEAYVCHEANDDDLLDLLIGPPPDYYRKEVEIAYPRYVFYSYGGGYGTLGQVSTRKPRSYAGKYDFHPAVQTAVQKVRQRIIELELQRGDLATPASRAAKHLRYSGGAETLIQLLQAFGNELFVRAYAYDGESKKAVYSHLIRTTFPGQEETPDHFAGLVKKANISEKRLLETAMYAPQWAAHIEHTINWPGLAQGVWWFHAHTKDMSWQVEQEVRAAWAAEINEQTPLSARDLLDGAVDVAWFHKTYATLGGQRWQALDKAAKYASGSGGHKRAQLFAEAMLGQCDQEALSKRIKDKRYQDGVRAIGLLPLPAENTEDILLQRYLVLQEFLRGSKKFGSQRQTSEKLAVRIGMENLARTAGYADPLRLEWAMEQHVVADLAEGPVSVTVAPVTITLAIDILGEPNVTVCRQLKNGDIKPLKNVPAKLKKKPDIAALVERKKTIRQQASRTRLSLEGAMVRGDVFSGKEIESLYGHPVLKPMLQQLLLIREDGLLGYPVKGGTSLAGTEDSQLSIKSTDQLRLAHPHDLLEKDWHVWQRSCFLHKRIQPFKQIFRELYIVTPVEVEAHDVSTRYAGQEVNPKQAMALFRQRGWLTHPEDGTRKTFHDENITAHVGVMNGILTPAEVGGETIETVFFTKRGTWDRLPLVDVPPRLFSEVMRDLDLVVSVAHLSGVDPEATQSSVEVRGNLVRETAVLLNLTNVTVKERHVLVDGQLNHYSIHLGSGVVHQRPGGYVCIVPVHNAQRGRVFLPFVDKDPKTAEIIAKTIMLANDKKIKDPTILEQLSLS